MRPPISFKEFLKLPEEVKESMGRFDNTCIREDLSGIARKKAMLDLEKRLKRKDWFYSYSSDQRVWKKGRDEDELIRKLVQNLGDDGMSLYKQYGKKAGAISEGKVKKKELKPASEYEVFLQMKMREWEIKSLDELEASLLKKFWAEVDSEWKGNTDVKMHEEKKRSMFPEMDRVTRQHGLGYGDGDRKTGEKSVTAGAFVDPGNLSYNQPQWQAPSQEMIKKWRHK